MKQTIRYTLRITSDQKRILEARANNKGFRQVGAYLRFALFSEDMNIWEKILEIHQAVVKK